MRVMERRNFPDVSRKCVSGVRTSCGTAACIAHDGEPGGSDREHDAVATVLIIGESRGIGLETVRAALRGFGAGDSRGYGGFLYSLGFHLLLGRVYDDKDVQERIVRSSKLDWVIVRPVILTDGPKTNAYRALIDPLAGDADSSRAPTWRILSLSRFTTTRLSA
jgi:hypothetical protein